MYGGDTLELLNNINTDLQQLAFMIFLVLIAVGVLVYIAYRVYKTFWGR